MNALSLGCFLSHVSVRRIHPVPPALQLHKFRYPGLQVGLPGLHDHHIHLLAFAASLNSVPCGPPHVTCERELAEALRARQPANPGAWIRGVGYHPSVAGDIDRSWLDRVLPPNWRKAEMT